MQTPSITPGNWQAAYYPEHETCLVTSDGATIAEVTTEPDARAIAALPQLVAALKELAGWAHSDLASQKRQTPWTTEGQRITASAFSALSAAGL